MWSVRVLVYFFLVGFEPILRGTDRRGPSRIVLRTQGALHPVIGRRDLTGGG